MTAVIELKSQPASGGAFDWADPFLLDDQLGEDERMIMASSRAYAQEKLQPRVNDAFLDMIRPGQKDSVA